MQPIIMHGKKCDLSLCDIFKWRSVFVGEKMCRKKRIKTNVNEGTAQASLRTLKKMCCACHKDTGFWIEMKWQS